MNMATKEIPLKEARDRHPFGPTPTSAEICLLTACRDRVLVEDSIAKKNLPPLITSTTDGFCITFADVRYTSPEVHVRLNILDDIPAGGRYTDSLARGEAARIATGATIPIRCTMSGGKCSKSA
jgi:molybdopterin biosynthesis enzyme